MPFDNKIVVIPLSGKDVVGTIARMAGKHSGALIGGAKVLYDSKSGNIQKMTIGGVPIDSAATYQLATTDYVYYSYNISQLEAVPKEEAYSVVGGPVISCAAGEHNRGRFYLYCRQHGLWPKEVTGHDPDAEPEAFDPLCPIRNVTEDYPPTLLLHGDQDTDVPYEQSVMMAEELSRAGVEHELITIPSGGHGFDARRDDPVVVEAFDRVMHFLEKHLKK
jgi:acetyl esterase/lipase